MIQDPAEELLAAVRRSRSSPSEMDQRAVGLVRRRFGLSLPPPFLSPSLAPDALVVRPATAVDGPAIAAVKWRAWRVTYRGLLPDCFLDDLAFEPPARYWTARAMVSPTVRHGLFVAGRPGTVVGVADLRPWRNDGHEGGLSPVTTTELAVLYVDPQMQRRGVGRALMDAAVQHAMAGGATELALWVAAGNGGARAFYENVGWQEDGTRQRFELAPGVALDEVCYRWRPDRRS